MMTQRTNIFLLFFCLSTMTIHAMNISEVSVPNKSNDKKTTKISYSPTIKNKRAQEREKTIAIKREREKKLSRILMTDPK